MKATIKIEGDPKLVSIIEDLLEDVVGLGEGFDNYGFSIESYKNNTVIECEVKEEE